MDYTKEEIIKAVEYAEGLTITAELHAGDGKTLVFKRSAEVPEDLPDDLKETIEICVEYHQRSVFMREYQANDPNPPVDDQRRTPIEDVNYFLEYYKINFIQELIKGMKSDNSVTEQRISPFAKVMMEHRRKT